MARTKAELGAGARLADFLSASLMARVVPPEVVHDVLNAHGCNSQRIRSFPAVAGVYYVMALSLYPEASYEAVFSAVSQGLAWEAGAPQPAGVSKVSISLLRQRIGAQPLADLVSRCCTPLADPDVHAGGFYRGLRLVAFDGSTFELADEPSVEVAFGRPGGRQGQAGYPQARCVLLAECGTHAILGANLGPYASGEWALCQPLLSRLRPDMLCLADRGFNGFEHWEQARTTGAQLLWRPPRQNSCRLHRTRTSGAAMKDELGPIRTGIQGQSGSEVAAAGERGAGGGGARGWCWGGHPGAVAGGRAVQARPRAGLDCGRPA